MKKIVFDENFAESIANGFSEFQKGRRTEGVEVHHVIPLVGRGAKDEVWIPHVGQLGGVAITHDFQIQKTQAMWRLVQQNDLGVFFFRPPKKKGYLYWEQVRQILKHWERIKDIALNESPPFGYVIKPKSRWPERLRD